MSYRLHVFGASASGTTSLARELAEALGLVHLDVDDYYWVASDPPFRHKEPIPTRIARLLHAMQQASIRGDGWVLSGSVVSWSDWLIPQLDAAIYVTLDQEERLARLIRRDERRYGSRIAAGGDMAEAHRAFLDWSAAYETAGLEIRSRRSHETWLQQLPCPLIRVDNQQPIREQIAWLGPILHFHRLRQGTMDQEPSQPGISEHPIIRSGVPSDATAISALIQSLSPAFAAQPDKPPEAFLAEITPAEISQLLTQGQVYFGVVDEGTGISALVSWRRPNHLLHLFIADHRQGCGWGKFLWHWVLQDRERFPEPITNGWSVNASRNAIDFYRKLGFKANGQLKEENGIAFLPMVAKPISGDGN